MNIHLKVHIDLQESIICLYDFLFDLLCNPLLDINCTTTSEQCTHEHNLSWATFHRPIRVTVSGSEVVA